MSTFIISSEEINKIKKTTTQIIPGSFMTRMDDLQIVYRVVGDTLTILSEIFDGRKVSYEGKPGQICHEYAALCAVKRVKTLKVGTSTFKPTWIINFPEGEYVAEDTIDGVVLHQRKGKVFVNVDGVYMNVDEDIPKLKRIYIELGTGMFIPDEYLFRVEKGGKFHYYPLRAAYGSLTVAQLTYRNTTEEMWLSVRASV